MNQGEALLWMASDNLSAQAQGLLTISSVSGQRRDSPIRPRGDVKPVIGLESTKRERSDLREQVPSWVALPRGGGRGAGARGLLLSGRCEEPLRLAQGVRAI